MFQENKKKKTHICESPERYGLMKSEKITVCVYVLGVGGGEV